MWWMLTPAGMAAKKGTGRQLSEKTKPGIGRGQYLPNNYDFGDIGGINCCWISLICANEVNRKKV